MIEKDNRPVHLNLLTINLPIIGISSILHRVSGLAVFVCFPLLVWLLGISLESEERFFNLQNLFQKMILFKVIIFLLFVGFVYHLLAGVKKNFRRSVWYRRDSKIWDYTDLANFWPYICCISNCFN